MATTSATVGDSTEEGSREVECPIEGCDYRGEPRSVEAHISGSQNGGHKGEFGRFYRGALEGEDLLPPGKVDLRGSEELEGEEGDEVDDGGVGSEVADTTEEPEVSEGLEEPEARGSGEDEQDQETGGVGGIPLPALTSKQLFLIVALTLVLLAWWARGRNSQDDVEDEDQDQEEDDEQHARTDDEVTLIE